MDEDKQTPWVVGNKLAELVLLDDEVISVREVEPGTIKVELEFDWNHDTTEDDLDLSIEMTSAQALDLARQILNALSI